MNFIRRLIVFFQVISLDMKTFNELAFWFYRHLLRWFLKRDKKYRLYTEYIKGKLVGFNLMYDNRIMRIAVKPKFQGKGIGKKLVPKNAGIVKTLSLRENTVKFYERLGFKITKTNEGFYKGKKIKILTLER